MADQRPGTPVAPELTAVAEAVHEAMTQLQDEDLEAAEAELLEALEMLERMGAVVELLPVTDAELTELLARGAEEPEE
jgi:hypothetical protein